MGHAIFSFQTKQKSIHFSDSRSKVRRQSFSDHKSQNVSCNTTTPACNARHVGFRMLFFSQNKKDALKENQCTSRWLLNGFLSHEMYNLLFWLSNKHVSGQDAELIFITILANKILVSPFTEENSYFGEKNGTPRFPPDPAFSTKPRVFHQTPHFPHPAFSTPRDPGNLYPGTPYPSPAFST